jgi:hypothetical protein
LKFLRLNRSSAKTFKGEFGSYKIKEVLTVEKGLCKDYFLVNISKKQRFENMTDFLLM